MANDFKFQEIPKHILIVEDDAPDVALVSKEIKASWPGCIVISVKSMREAHKQYKKHNIDIVLLDLNLPDGFGPQTVKDARKFVKVPIIVMTNMLTDITTDEAIKNGANNVITKRDIIHGDFVGMLKQYANAA